MEKGRLSGSTFDFNPTLSECNDVQGLLAPMSPADELFCNGRVRLMKPSAVLQKTRFPNFEHRIKAQQSVISKKGDDVEENYNKGRQRLWRSENESRHCCTVTSNSPQRNYYSHSERISVKERVEGNKVAGAASSSTWPKPRGSRRTWSFRDIFLPRSKSEGREQVRDEWEVSFSSDTNSSSSEKQRAACQGKPAQNKKTGHYLQSPNRMGVTASAQERHYISSPLRRGVPISAHELHYTANRAQAEELRKKTFLPYRQGLLACLGYPSTPAFPRGPVLQPLY